MLDLETVLEANYQKWKHKGHIYEKKDGAFWPVTYGAFLEQARSLARALIARGFQNKTIMVYGKNSSSLMMADLAILHYVGISVWVSKEWGTTELQDAIRLLDIACVIYGEDKQGIVNQVAEHCKATAYLPIQSLLPGPPLPCKAEPSQPCIPTGNQQCCKIVFSSGTTATPKAVMLSKENLFAGVDSLYRRCPFREQDAAYLCLPLSHTYGGIYNFLYSLVFGFSLYLCSDISAISQEILQANPTIFCGVPMIYKRFREACGNRLAEAFGTRIRYLFCGGAYMEPELRKTYKDNGLNLMEAYALSETASTFSIQYPYDPDIDSVGTIAEGLQVKILQKDENGIGEIAVKGDNVFLGYAKNPQLTEAAFTKEGFFKTGDIGYLKNDERNGGQKLYLVGRKKKVLIGDHGENIEQDHLEALLCQKNKNISRAVLYLQQGQLCCRIYLKSPCKEDWEAFFRKWNESVPSHERIRKYEALIDSPEKRWKE